MSKTKTKQRRREAKRDSQKKAVKNAHKATPKPLSKPTSTSSTNARPSSKTQERNTTAPKADSNSVPVSKPHIQASQKHEVPFGVYDRILLVGEGDFSFARSLAVEHGCANVTATSYDTEEEVREKYPTFPEMKKALSELSPPVPILHDIDATKISTYKSLRKNVEEEAGEEEEWESWDTITFMFPHTGGLSTDVNRQVRANQAVLVEFLKSCVENTEKHKAARRKRENEQKAARRKLEDKRPIKEEKAFLKMGGKVIVTLFEGEPYTLWNIRDLARHAGLKIAESWKFDWGQYPGYHHVRTLGAIEGGGGWKGEERDARMFVFKKIPLELDSEEEREKAKQKKKKRKRDADKGSGSDSDE
jgi:25S rRNA (uracil2634-N3)-methyltransferase